MQTSVKLQEPFSYSAYYIMIILILILIMTIYFLLKEKKKKSKIKVVQIKETSQEDKENIKIKYIEKLNLLENKLNNNEISTRVAYQELSSNIRYFVYELTDIQVQNYTLKEIKEINIPILYELIKECYIPEFAMRYLGDIKSSIEKTREVIKRWN